jgi:hypothetical protein
MLLLCHVGCTLQIGMTCGGGSSSSTSPAWAILRMLYQLERSETALVALLLELLLTLLVLVRGHHR